MTAAETVGVAAFARGAEHKGLKSGAIGLVSTTVIAVSSVAPAYSLALLPFVGALMLTGLFVKACFYYWDPANSNTSFAGTGEVLNGDTRCSSPRSGGVRAHPSGEDKW